MFPCSLSPFAVSSEHGQGRHTSSTSPHPVPAQGRRGGRGLSWESRQETPDPGAAQEGPPGVQNCQVSADQGHSREKIRLPPAPSYFPSYEWETEACLSHFPRNGAKPDGRRPASLGTSFPAGEGDKERQAKDTHALFFPSFNLKQKRHRGSKIKISFFPLPKPLPRSAPAPTPSSPAGAGEGKVEASPAGRGGGLGGGCQARCPSLSKYKYMFQNSWEILPRPPPKHSALARGVWRGAGAWGAPGTGWLWFTVLREPPAAHCKSGDTQGPHGRWGLPRSASRCWGSHTSTPHAARSETSCTEEREEKAVEKVLKPAAFPSSLEAY